MERKTRSVINWHYRMRALTEGAILIALAEILSFLPFYKFPWGGSVDLAMAPILLFAVRWGVKWGLVEGLAFGTLQMIFEGGVAIGWQSILGDFLVAFTALGLAGICRGMEKGIFAGTLVGGLARFLVHYVVGATIWAEYMPEEFFGMTMTTPWVYSALYNGAYMVPDAIMVLIAGILLMKTPAKRYVLGQDLK